MHKLKWANASLWWNFCNSTGSILFLLCLSHISLNESISFQNTRLVSGYDTEKLTHNIMQATFQFISGFISYWGCKWICCPKKAITMSSLFQEVKSAQRCQESPFTCTNNKQNTCRGHNSPYFVSQNRRSCSFLLFIVQLWEAWIEAREDDSMSTIICTKVTPCNLHPSNRFAVGDWRQGLERHAFGHASCEWINAGTKVELLWGDYNPHHNQSFRNDWSGLWTWKIHQRTERRSCSNMDTGLIEHWKWR